MLWLPLKTQVVKWSWINFVYNNAQRVLAQKPWTLPDPYLIPGKKSPHRKLEIRFPQ